MTRQDAFDQLDHAVKELRDEIKRILTPALEALNRFAKSLGL